MMKDREKIYRTLTENAEIALAVKSIIDILRYQDDVARTKIMIKVNDWWEAE